MKILERGMIFSGAQTPDMSSCCFPSVCQLQDGTLLASFRTAGEKGPYNRGEQAKVCLSRDNGKTWSQPEALLLPPEVDGKPTTLRVLYFTEVAPDHLLAVANGVDATMEELPYYNEQTEGLKDTYLLVAHSYDGGKTWEPFRRVQVETFRDMPLPLTGAPFHTADGRIGIQFEVNKPYYETAYWVHHSAAVYSSDGGQTWGEEVVITDSPTVYYWDQRIDTLQDGRVVDIFWTFDRDKGDYINIHLCQSMDGGRSFGTLTDTGLVGQPGNVIDGADGKLLAVYINRDGAPVIRLAESADGQVWTDVLTVFDYGEDRKAKANAGMNDVWSEMGAFCVGHPFVKRLQDGTLMVYFYNGPSTHRTDVHYVKIAE